MLATQRTQPLLLPRQTEPAKTNTGLGQLFAAAVVNREFRETLLENAETALKNGYLGERFELSRDERERLLSARARSLAELARTVMLP